MNTPEPNELDVSAEYLKAVALKIMREPAAKQVGQAIARADRLEIAMRAALAVAVLKEFSYQECSEIASKFKIHESRS